MKAFLALKIQSWLWITCGRRNHRLQTNVTAIKMSRSLAWFFFFMTWISLVYRSEYCPNVRVVQMSRSFIVQFLSLMPGWCIAHQRDFLWPASCPEFSYGSWVYSFTPLKRDIFQAVLSVKRSLLTCYSIHKWSSKKLGDQLKMIWVYLSPFKSIYPSKNARLTVVLLHYFPVFLHI